MNQQVESNLTSYILHLFNSAFVLLHPWEWHKGSKWSLRWFCRSWFWVALGLAGFHIKVLLAKSVIVATKVRNLYLYHYNSVLLLCCPVVVHSSSANMHRTYSRAVHQIRKNYYKGVGSHVYPPTHGSLLHWQWPKVCILSKQCDYKCQINECKQKRISIFMDGALFCFVHTAFLSVKCHWKAWIQCC